MVNTQEFLEMARGGILAYKGIERSYYLDRR